MNDPEIAKCSDDDIFIVEEIKPAYKKVHREVKEDFVVKQKLNEPRKTSGRRKRGHEKTNTNVSLRQTNSKMPASVVNSSVNSNVAEQKTEKTNLQSSQESKSSNDNVKNCSPRKISDYFVSLNATPEKQNSSRKQTEGKNFQISPTIIRKRKRFLMHDPNFKSSPQKNYQRNISGTTAESCDNLKTDSPSDEFTIHSESMLGAIVDSIECQDSAEIDIKDIGIEMKDSELGNQNIELLCDILKNIIHNELEKQINLESKGHEEGKVIEKLLSDEEIGILKKFFLLEKNACKLYVRMLCRKKGLYRVSTLNFKDINADLEKEFKSLEKENFVKIDTDEEDLQTQMNLLNISDISKLCKNFKVSTTSKKKIVKKSELICSLIQNCKKQKGMSDFLENKKGLSRLEMLKKEVKSSLGMCVKLNESFKSAFQKIILLFSFAHYHDVEEKRIPDQLYMCLNVKKNYIQFPQYELTPTVIFQCRSDFLQYEKALLMQSSLDVAIDSKNFENVSSIATEARNEFNKILNDDGFQKRFLSLQPFLMKFSAGSIYARILTKYCTKLKKKNDNNEVISIMRMLLEQNLFLTSKRGEWYEILAQAFLNLKNNIAAIQVLIESQKDSLVNEVQKLHLQLKGQAVKKKIKEFHDIFKNELDLFTVSIQDPSSIEITSKVLEGNKAGYKSVFIEESENCVSLTSVEERALSYYKSNGFARGCHGENYIVKVIYFLLFNDIIYGPSPPGAFQSAYQQNPLDFYSKYFYIYRKESIDSLLDEMCKWTNKEVEERLTISYFKNYNLHGIMNWGGNHFKTPEKNLETLQMFVEFLECITMPVYVHICRRLLKSFRIYSSGFPDLTLWDLESKKCKFVEVKGPKDKLSPAQRIWLNFLEVNGIDCEVCYVKCNLGRKSMKGK